MYKKSTMQTEGNQLRKRGKHAKLTSITSEVKEPSTSFDYDPQTLDMFGNPQIKQPQRSRYH
jgi:hypothetical protein